MPREKAPRLKHSSAKLVTEIRMKKKQKPLLLIDITKEVQHQWLLPQAHIESLISASAALTSP